MKGQPLRILRFCGRNFSLFFQAASHFLPPELKVRLRGAQSSVQWYDNFTIALNSRFLHFAKGETSKFSERK